MTRKQPDSFEDFVLDQLSSIEGVTARSMFGSHGLYHGKTFFGILRCGRLFLKDTVRTRLAFEQRGMKPIRRP